MDDLNGLIQRYEQEGYFDYRNDIGISCPDCGSQYYSHNPLDDSDYICNECGYHFNG